MSLRVCLVEGEMGRMEKKRERENCWKGCLIKRGRVFWWVQEFSLFAHQNTISPNWRENER